MKNTQVQPKAPATRTSPKKANTPRPQQAPLPMPQPKTAEIKEVDTETKTVQSPEKKIAHQHKVDVAEGARDTVPQPARKGFWSGLL